MKHHCYPSILSILVIAWIQFQGCAIPESTRETETGNPSEVARPRPSWLSEEPLIVVGNWDSAPIFRRRKGGNPLWHEAAYRREHSEEAVVALKKLGVTLVIIHFYKGFGLQAERRQLDDARKLASLCKKHGLRVGVYIGSTIAYETFLLEKPEAVEWFVPPYLGSPVVYGGTQTFRKRVYFMHPGFVEYMKRVVRIAIEELHADLIHFDNTSLRARRAVFHHPLAVEHFRGFLRERYAPEELERRLGFSDVTFVEPPAYEKPLAAIDDPLFQEWSDFRCHQLERFYAEMEAFIRKLDPEVAVENNPHSGLSGVNTVWEQGVDYPRLLSHTDIVWTEEGNEAGVNEDGTLISKIRTYKQATHLGNKIFTFTGDSLLQMAESMAFNRGCLGMVGGVLAGLELSEQDPAAESDDPYTWGGAEPGFRMTPEKKAYIDFFRDNFRYYRDPESGADVAVLRSFPTMAFNNGRPYQSTYLFEQTLIQGHVPFDIISDRDLSHLRRYRLLILPDQEALSDSQLEAIRAYVKAGGALVATEHTSLYTEWRLRRQGFGLEDLFQISPPRWQARGRRPEPVLKTEVRREVGSGRVVYLPEVIPQVEKPATEPMTSEYWKLPLNSETLLSAVKWALGPDLSIEVQAYPLTVVEMTVQKEKRRKLIHLLNYDVARNPRTEKIRVSIRHDLDQAARVALHSPGRDGEVNVPFQSRDGRIEFVVPPVEVYSLVVVEF